MTDSLGGDLKQYIYETHANGPRRDSHWVMSLEWFNELRRMEDAAGVIWQPHQRNSAPELLLGIPIEIREDAGAPRLELDG